MKTSKTFIFWACMSVCSLEAFSQCNVKVRDGGDQIALDATTEVLYRNEDLENGLFSVRGSNSLFYNKTDKTIHVKHMVSIFVGTSGGQKELTPRQLTISFSNGESITLTAETITDPQFINGAKLLGCGFQLTDKQTLKVIDYKISSMTIADNRTGQSFKFKPFDGIFQEQIKCIIVKADGL